MLSPAEILARTASVYASCRTYRDEGLSSTDFLDISNLWRTRTTRVEFRSVFERATGFRFTFQSFEVGPQSSVPAKESLRGEFRRRHGGAEGWSALEGRIFAPDQPLSVMAGKRAAGRGIASFVAGLLVPDSSGESELAVAGTARELGEDDVEGRACLGIQGTTRAGARFDLWIDRESFLVRRMQSRSVPQVELRRDRRRLLEELLRTSKSEDELRRRLARHLQEQIEAPRPTYRTETTTIWRAQFDIDLDAAAFGGEPS